MRKTGICAKCEHPHLLQILHASNGLAREDLAIRKKRDGILGEVLESVGQLSAVMCRKCGYTEHYVKDPETVVPDGTYIVELSAPSGTGPLR